MSYFKIGEINPSSQIAYTGTEVVISCTSSTLPVWTKKDGVIRSTLTRTPILVLGHVTERDTGTYICNGKYENGYIFKKTSDIFVGGKTL